jgi:ADP-ribosylglycohydrolase
LTSFLKFPFIFTDKWQDNFVMKVIPIRPHVKERFGRVDLDMRRFRGCILGAAVGDALGAPLEAMRREQIRELTGQKIDRYITTSRHPRLSLGQWTDDTALALAAAESISEQGELDVEAIRLSMMQMYHQEPDRGYGLATRRALDSMVRRGRPRPSNGAAMRIHPVALFCSNYMEGLLESVTEVSRITHHHEDAVDAAVAVAFAVAVAARAELEPTDLIRQTIAYLRPHSNMGYKLQEVADLLFADVTTEEGLEQIGTRGLALETVGSAIFVFLRTPDDFYRSVVSAVNAGGDTDTIGAITGAISGTYNGVEAIPKRWLSHLEARNEIDELSQRLFWVAG